MAAGVANVKTVITVQGNDAASRSINKANKSLGRMGGRLRGVQTRAAAAGASLRAMATGDITGAVSGMSAALGGAGGLVTAAAAATVGVAAVGAAVAVAAVKFTEFSVKINRMKAGMDAALGPKGLEKAIAISNALGGVSAESIGKVATRLKLAGVNATFTADQLTELTKRATVAGKTGDEALEALAAAIEKGNTRALKLVGTFINSGRVLDDYAKAVGKTTTELTSHEQQMAVVAAIQANLAKRIGQTTAAHDRQDQALSKLSNEWLKFKVILSDTAGGSMVAIVEGISQTIGVASRLGVVVIKLVQFAFRPMITMIESVTTGLATMGLVVARLADKDFSGAFDEIKRGFREFKKISVDDNLKSFLDLGESVVNVYENIGKAQKKVSADLKITGAPAVAGRSVERGRRKTRKASPEIAALEQAREGRRLRAEIRKEEEAEKDAALEQAREGLRLRAEIRKEEEAEKDAVLQAALARSEMLRQVETEEINRGFDRLDMLAKEKAARSAMLGTMADSGKAVAVGVAGMIESERARAGIMALVAAADSARMFAIGNYPGGIAAGFAAVQYARAALMPAPATGAAAGGAGATPTGSALTPVGGGGGSTQAININFGQGFVVGTPQQVGKAIQGAVGSLHGTGMATQGAV